MLHLLFLGKFKAFKIHSYFLGSKRVEGHYNPDFSTSCFKPKSFNYKFPVIESSFLYTSAINLGFKRFGIKMLG